MKHNQLIRKLYFIKIIALFLLTLVMSCQKEKQSTDLGSEKQGVLQLSFESNNLKNQLITTFKGSLKIDWTPEWNKVTTNGYEKDKIHFVPLNPQTRQTASKKESS